MILRLGEAGDGLGEVSLLAITAPHTITESTVKSQNCAAAVSNISAHALNILTRSNFKFHVTFKERAIFLYRSYLFQSIYSTLLERHKRFMKNFHNF